MGREDDSRILTSMLEEWRKTNSFLEREVKVLEALEDIHQDLRQTNQNLVLLNQTLQSIVVELQQPLPAVRGKIFLGTPVNQ